MMGQRSLILSLAAMIMVDGTSTTFGDTMPAFKVPNFDYRTLTSGNTPNNVLGALKKDGIVSFTNVPSYAQVRRSYLDVAAACTVSAQDTNAAFLLQKTLTDGTKRYTIGATSGQNADASAAQTDMTCPGYKQVYDEFSSLLEMVVLSVATTLDATTFTTKDGHGQTITSRNLVTDAVRLDHFHAYETPSRHDRRLQSASSVAQPTLDQKFAMNWHTDSGLFIVFATPSFYKVNHNNGTKSTIEPARGVDNAETGLFIQRHDGQPVRPMLKLDQVTLMVGTGYNEWVDVSAQLPAVLHAMRMPNVEVTATQRVLRTWFGKMTLLPLYQRLLKPMDFAEHVNLTSKREIQGLESTHQRLGCAPSRRLEGSACNVQQCNSDQCNTWCNHGMELNQCRSNNCACTTKTTDGIMCWQTCYMKPHTC